MTSVRYYLDENVTHGPIVARELRLLGIDAVTATEKGRAGRGIPDQEQLRYARLEGRVMVTEDLHFRPDLPHCGLVIMQRPLGVGGYILYLQTLAEQVGERGLDDQTHYCAW